MLRNTSVSAFLTVLTCFCLLFLCCKNEQAVSNATAKPLHVNQLLGKWQSVDNPKNQIEFTNSRMYAYSGALKLSDESLVVYPECHAKCLPVGVAPMPCFVTDGKRAENCFQVLALTDNKLTYALIGQEEKVMKFQRM
ncbi:MAG: hypothetical protein AAGJ18_03000 [Bacteroidota bacterium]